MNDTVINLRDIQRRIKSGADDISPEDFRFIAEAAREERRTADGGGKKTSKKAANIPENLSDLFGDVKFTEKGS